MRVWMRWPAVNWTSVTSGAARSRVLSRLRGLHDLELQPRWKSTRHWGSGAVQFARNTADLWGMGPWELVVWQDRVWLGEPRLARITIYLDGGRIGSVLPGERVHLQVPPGSHSVRVRQWWYMSSRVTVDPAAGTVVIRVSKPMDRFWVLMAGLIRHPTRRFVVEALDVSDPRLRTSQEAVADVKATITRWRRRMLFVGLASLAFFTGVLLIARS
jgi:hypothetical protein